MQLHPLHRWDLSASEAIALQQQLASRVVTNVPLPACNLIAGADVSFDQGSSRFYAGVVVLRVSDLTVVERRGVAVESHFPYIPGLLSFREAPALLHAFARVESAPDLVMCDGQGIAHQRRLGLASHVGLWLEVPCLGCAKSKLVGTFGALGEAKGSTTPLRYRGAVVGSVVRTKSKIQPVFVSPGHRIDLDSSVRWVLAVCHRHRIPEPTRLAHEYVNELRRGETPLG